MKVAETTLQELLGGAKQFRVPLFQRTYTWKERDHVQLWHDIMTLYADMRADNAHETIGARHFIGSFVLAATPSSATVPAFLVVDGQQRLTTLTILLAALREVAATTDPVAFERITNSYLVNQYKQGDDHFKFVPTNADRAAYVSCIQGKHSGSARDLISKAYAFFLVQLSQSGPDDEPLDIVALEDAIVSRLAIVDITAQQDDNVHRIFESLNATGVGLTQADLLRNYLFMLMPNRANAVYDEVWVPMQDDLGVDRLEGLARVDLRRRGIAVRDDDVYRAQQTRLRPIEHSEVAIEAAVRDLAVRARHYKRILFPANEVHVGVRRHLEFLSRWRATIMHPLVMHMYSERDAGRLSADEMANALLNVESFLVRRFMVGASGKNLNNIVAALMTSLLAEEKPILDVVRVQLSGARKNWASDEEVRLAAESRPLYYYGRAEQRRMILERLEEAFAHKEQGSLADLALSVEHVMPQTLSAEWIVELSELDTDPERTHRELVHTLGNLTLTGYNAELSNNPFDRKQQIYGDSHLSLNKSLQQQARWGRAEITKRARELADLAISIWPAPEEVSEKSFGFDWSRMHAAIAAIPDGKWTTYGDLAALAGTSAQAVGVHIATNPALSKAYRVLTWDGQISEGFAWSDPTDDRDPRAVLASEGVDFVDGKALQAQRLPADSLMELLGWFDPDDDYPNVG